MGPASADLGIGTGRDDLPVEKKRPNHSKWAEWRLDGVRLLAHLPLFLDLRVANSGFGPLVAGDA